MRLELSWGPWAAAIFREKVAPGRYNTKTWRKWGRNALLTLSSGLHLPTCAVPLADPETSQHGRPRESLQGYIAGQEVGECSRINAEQPTHIGNKIICNWVVRSCSKRCHPTSTHLVAQSQVFCLWDPQLHIPVSSSKHRVNQWDGSPTSQGAFSSQRCYPVFPKHSNLL